MKAMSALIYPTDKTVAQIDDYHGTKVADPYRWLEDLDSADTRAWIEAREQGDVRLSRRRFPAAIDMKQRLTAVVELRTLLVAAALRRPLFLHAQRRTAEPGRVVRGRHARRNATRAARPEHPVDRRHDCAQGLGGQRRRARIWPMGCRRAARTGKNGTCSTSATGKNTDDDLKWVKFSGLSWRRDGTGFFYSRYDEPKGENSLKAEPTSSRNCTFTGSARSSPTTWLIYERQGPSGLAVRRRSHRRRPLSGCHHQSHHRADQTRVCYRDLARKQNESTHRNRDRRLGRELPASSATIGHIFYFLTDNDAPRYRVIADRTARTRTRRTGKRLCRRRRRRCRTCASSTMISSPNTCRMRTATSACSI